MELPGETEYRAEAMCRPETSNGGGIRSTNSVREGEISVSKGREARNLR